MSSRLRADPPPAKETISVCIATYKRLKQLEALLDDLGQQLLMPHEIVVVDNDADGSARPVVEGLGARLTVPVKYEVQPERNIALTRNRTVHLASGDWLAFIDDDERAPADWLQKIFDAAAHYAADGVLGPVIPELPPNAPEWIQRGRFYDFPRLPTGTVVPLNRMRFGNVLLRGVILRNEPGPFDTSHQLATGEDCDLLSRLARKGARIVWCDEAAVKEPVEQRRMSLSWIMMRALSGGQEFARNTVDGTYGPVKLPHVLKLVLISCAQLAVALPLAILLLPLGRHHSARWLTRAWSAIGKLSVFSGWKYQAYA